MKKLNGCLIRRTANTARIDEQSLSVAGTFLNVPDESPSIHICSHRDSVIRQSAVLNQTAVAPGIIQRYHTGAIHHYSDPPHLYGLLSPALETSLTVCVSHRSSFSLHNWMLTLQRRTTQFSIHNSFYCRLARQCDQHNFVPENLDETTKNSKSTKAFGNQMVRCFACSIREHLLLATSAGCENGLSSQHCSQTAHFAGPGKSGNAGSPISATNYTMLGLSGGEVPKGLEAFYWPKRIRFEPAEAWRCSTAGARPFKHDTHSLPPTNVNQTD